MTVDPHCASVRARLLETAGARPAEHPAGVREHLASCPACRVEAEAIRALVAETRDALADGAGGPPAGALPRFEDVVCAVGRTRAPAAPARPVSRVLARVAALLFAALSGAALDRALLRRPEGLPPIAAPSSPDPAFAPTREDYVREAFAARPGGLAASLAALSAAAAPAYRGFTSPARNDRRPPGSAR